MRGLIASERGFTLLEVMVGIVLLTFGLLAVADVFSRGIALGLYGEDQTRGAGLAQQELEFMKTVPTSASPCPGQPIAQTTNTGLNCLVGDYKVGLTTSYFDANGNPTAQATAYYSRDVQVQYWPWDSVNNKFVGTAPYVVPGGPYVFRLSVATHWAVRGQTTFKSGQATNGCIIGGVAVPTSLGCLQISTFVSP